MSIEESTLTTPEAAISEDISIEQAILEKVRALPLEKKQEILDFAEFLEYKKAPPKPKKLSSRGILAGMGVDLTEEDIAEGDGGLSQAAPGDKRRKDQGQRRDDDLVKGNDELE